MRTTTQIRDMPRGAALAAPAWLALVALAACQSREPACSSAAPGTPVPLASFDPAKPDEARLRWPVVGGDPVAYEVEASVDGSVPPTFRPLGLYWGTFPSGRGELRVPLDASVPELRTLTFRVRSVGCSAGVSDWGAVEVRRPLHAPSRLEATRQGEGVVLTWVAHSSAQTAWLLERSCTDLAGAVVADWTERPVPFPSDRWLDPVSGPCADGARVSYRLRARAGEVLSFPAETWSEGTGLLAPIGLVAQVEAAAAILTWTNQSAAATEIVVRRDGKERAVLAPSATRYEDAGLAAGRYTYEVLARRPIGAGKLPLISPPTTTRVETSLGGLAVAHVALPAEGSRFARGAGWYAVVTPGQLGQPYALARPVAVGWDRHEIAVGARLEEPGVLLDAQARPHLVYAEVPLLDSASVPIIHAWYAGGAWQREVIAERVFAAGDMNAVVRATLDPAGALHVVWKAGLDEAMGLEYATNAGGAWTVESLSELFPAWTLLAGNVDFVLAAASDGEVHVAVWNHRAMVLAVRGASNWKVENVTSSVSVSRGSLRIGRAAGTTLVAWLSIDAVVAFARAGGSEAGTWSGPIIFATADQYDPGSLSIAALPAGRIAVAHGGDVPTAWILEVQRRAWTPALRGFASENGVDVGFRDDGKLWMLDRGASGDPAPEGLRDHLLYEEQ